MSKHFKPFLGILALVFLSSFCSSENVSANSTKLSLKIKPVLETSVNYDPITIEANGNLNISDVALRVSSNNRTGFKTFMSTIYNSSEENATALKYEDIDVIETLSEDNLSAENFTMNKWGYSVDNGSTFNSFKAKDLTPSEVLATESAADSGSKNIKVGIKVNDNIISGNYVNTLLFTTVPNYNPITLEDIVYMQEVTPEICEATPNEEQYQLDDIRDSKTYWVARLADGNCWMTQNLDYDLSVAANQTLTPATSNVTENRTVVPANTDLATFKVDGDAIYYLDGGDTYYANGTTKTEGYSSLPEDSIDRHYAQGDYYSWKAATAGQGTTSIRNADVNESICPAGWRLPTSDSADANYSFGNLVKQYGYSGSYQSGTTDATLLASPLFFARGGSVHSGSLYSQGIGGNYWSSRAEIDGFYAYLLDFYSSTVSPSSSTTRNSGFSVRCVAQGKDLSSISTMQEMTPEIVANTSVNASKQLTDTRDGKKYWVTKLADGNIWMTQNLDLDLSTTTTLTPADSDVTANWTPSRATIAGAANISSYTNDNNTPYSFDPGNYYFDGTYYSSSTCNYLTTTCAHFAQTPYGLNGEHGHIGNYYNWSAAVASNNTSATTAAGTDINTSICPKGWRLPHGYQSAQGNDFATLNTAYGGATNSDSVILANPLFFVRGGDVISGSLYDSASIGGYWSSTANSATVADVFLFASGRVGSSDYSSRGGGFSVRCLAR